MNENVKKILSGPQLWYVATISDEPNVVPVGFKMVQEDGTLLIGDCMMVKTIANIQENGKVAIAVCDPETSESYQIKGCAEYFAGGEVVDAMNAGAEAMGLPVRAKGAIRITPEQVIVATPGPDNNKVL